MPKLNHRRATSLIAGFVLVALLLSMTAYFWSRQDHALPAKISASNPYGRLIERLSALETELNKGMSAARLNEYAFEIENAIQLHPLPEGDDVQFTGELVRRYLRSLAALQNYRQLKMEKGGPDPLDPHGPSPNAEAIENQKQLTEWLRKRVVTLRDMLAQQNPPA